MRFVLALLAAGLIGAAGAGTTAYVLLDDRIDAAEQRVPVSRTEPAAPLQPVVPAAPAAPVVEDTSVEIDSELLQIMGERIAKLEYRVQLICGSQVISRQVFENGAAVGVESCDQG